ncbi:hypothetical protein PMAYCL1PPCAC_00776 [Pristionchus mayeri]|uniref:G protein-coupled receptor n=1 Tax=Pristionchus mayeri TaxID=1317129 RepID=A0AAN4Z115_9BILA|nr:hypothetical protein PMAYCL1PPCAC_00776 [Pristionchus mayeri]
MSVLTDILDYSLLVVNLYVLLRIRISREESFRTPFFYWFFMTGIASSFSVVGFFIGSRMQHTVEEGWRFKLGYMTNSFCITFATIGKTFISIHRYSVMRTNSCREDRWGDKMSYILTAITCVLSFGGCMPVFWCGLTYKVVDNVTMVLYLDDECTITQKSRSSAVYFLYVIICVVLTALTSREFVKMSRMVESSTRRHIISSQRNMFIIVFIGTVTQMVKAVHQFCWVPIAIFKLDNLNLFLQNTYDIVHYVATYSFTASLVIFNKRVRRLMMSMKIRDAIIVTSSN